VTAVSASAQEPWTIRKVLTWTADHFKKKDVDAPRLAAEVLLAFTLKTDRVRLYVDLDRPLSREELTSYRALIERRCAGEPTQYLTGTREFYNRPFRVDPRVLIPRPETELLVEAVLRGLPKDQAARVLDLCTGSGCIAVTLAAEHPLAHVTAVELSPEALALARENARTLGVTERIQFFEGDLFGPVPPEERFTCIVSNPPYIASAELAGLSREVLKEPRLALDGGADGLELIRRIVAGSPSFLVPGGTVALEIGEGQGPAVAALMTSAGYKSVRVEKDLARLDRLVFGICGASPPT
jgi:release factor glutamine methyltransferase